MCIIVIDNLYKIIWVSNEGVMIIRDIKIFWVIIVIYFNKIRVGDNFFVGVFIFLSIFDNFKVCCCDVCVLC